MQRNNMDWRSVMDYRYAVDAMPQGGESSNQDAGAQRSSFRSLREESRVTDVRAAMEKDGGVRLYVKTRVGGLLHDNVELGSAAVILELFNRGVQLFSDETVISTLPAGIISENRGSVADIPNAEIRGFEVVVHPGGDAVAFTLALAGPDARRSSGTPDNPMLLEVQTPSVQAPLVLQLLLSRFVQKKGAVLTNTDVEG